MNENEVFIKCDCGTELLHIEKDEEYDDIYFSLWYYGNQPLSIKGKLRWMWAVIKGQPYPDTVIVSKERVNNELLPKLLKLLSLDESNR